ncbi:hypothetical protein [Deinococcus cellulosilyticus]|uniref:ABC-2 type transport system permease protein n=1 Tax=Deinococcus cellulosilyticus (strain DSM 18568 / NBRC 106333 / KACC 11606 / 5516J-15) TaxID=1223518 RepID=A0A511NC53_DEIC1|nr:hypothetical protein [Deinococcus cellulosilyticus]GEM50078.1 hypothetical protein DC3_57130 [Deinococcus cellulosilyticus NBRC 106333 = KACC 11606]
MRPGSLPWLLRFEVLLYWRSLFSSSQKWVVILLGVLVLGAIGGMWFLLREHSQTLRAGPAELPQPLLLPLTLFGLFAALLMVTTAIQTSVKVMFERKDLDLLISSPVSTRGIFAVRVLGVVLAVTIWWMLLGTAVAILGLLLGTWRFLGLPVGFLTLGSVISTLAVGLTFLLVKSIGVQRTRTIIQVLTVLLGAVLFLGTQLPNLMGTSGQGGFGDRAARWFVEVQQQLPESSPLWYWARSLWLEPVPTLITVAIGLLFLTLVIFSSHRAYLKGASEASGFNRPRPERLKTVPFRSGVFQLLWLKEWKLVLRDPALFSQLLLQVVYMLPLVFVLSGAGRGNAMSSLMNPAFWVAGVVLISSTLTGWLSRIFIGAEDLPDLLSMAPHPRGTLRRQKMWITLLPVLLIFVPLALLLGKSSPVLMLMGVALVCISCLTIAYLQTQWAQPIKRADLMNKSGKGQGNAMQGFVELFTSVGWAGVIAAYGQNNTTWMLIAGGVAVFFPLLFTVLNWKRGSTLGY